MFKIKDNDVYQLLYQDHILKDPIECNLFHVHMVILYYSYSYYCFSWMFKVTKNNYYPVQIELNFTSKLNVFSFFGTLLSTVR